MEILYTALSVFAMIYVVAYISERDKSFKKSGKQALDHIHTEQVFIIIALIIEVGALYFAYVNKNTFEATLWTINIVLAMTNLYLSEKKKQKELSRID